MVPEHREARRGAEEQLKAVDAVVEVRDIRIPLATTHPDIPDWIGNKLRVLVLNRADMVTDAERGQVGLVVQEAGEKHVVLTDAKTGRRQRRDGGGASVAKEVNEKRRERACSSARAGGDRHPKRG